MGVSQPKDKSRLRNLFFSVSDIDINLFCRKLISQKMMKLIFILGLLVATAHCGTERRRTARAKTPRSEMSRKVGDVDSDSARQRDLKTPLKSSEEESRESIDADSNATRQDSWSYPKGCTGSSDATVALKKAVLDAFRLYSDEASIAQYVSSNTGSSRHIMMIPVGKWRWRGSTSRFKCINYRGYEVFILY